jgi:hypothetical protein
MSERPLFQNTDEQEAAYAPQELPAGAAQRAVEVDEARGGRVDLADSGVLPAAPAAEASMTGIGPSAEAYGLASGAPSAASTAGVTDADDEDAAPG